MPKAIEYNKGDIIGAFLFIEDVGRIKTGGVYLRAAKFKCPICGNDFTCIIQRIKNFRAKSCGCVKNRGGGSIKHGMAGTNIYSTWHKVRSRCNNLNNPHYGGKGVSICKRWASFENFYADMGNKPTPQHTLDRYPDNNGNYEPGNVRWATRTEQNNNKTNNILIQYKDRVLNLKQWSVELGIKYITLFTRYSYGWSVEDIFNKPLKKRDMSYLTSK